MGKTKTDLMTAGEVQEFLDISPSTMFRLVRQDHLKVIRPLPNSPAIRFDRAAVAKLKAQRAAKKAKVTA
jgi:predicted DNA-binding transcriptional regulator AlpA